MYVSLGHVPRTDILSAYVPVRSHVVLHVPALQVAVPPLAGHTLPHVPQFATVFRLVSQPLFGFPSQFPKPALQLAMPQLPATHCGVPLAAVQTVPHAPQLVTVLTGVSQPFVRDASQSLKPAEQLGTQVEAAQLVVPCAFVHALLQAPQLAVLLLSCTSQPLPGAPSQLA
jgi:hypothetical protein